MNAEELKQKLKEILGNQIIFNKQFGIYADSIKNIDTNLIEWCILLRDRKIQPTRASQTMGIIIFINKIGSSNRCIVIKVVNGEFKEVHLADHKYYDELRIKLGLKQSSR
ncbi:hypothetical protein HZA96_00145 [Candidatus Woesearchaeota archaeon]|nr:hypothetical protein [Candidatus Woesearchaeota archaeon]